MGAKVKFAFYMNCVSAHQLPLAREVVKIVDDAEFIYVDADEMRQGGAQEIASGEAWITRNREHAEDAETLLTGMFDAELFARRKERGLTTLYTSERWFKPIYGLPGCIRRLIPFYRKRIKSLVGWVNGDEMAKVLAIGPWAKRDFLSMGVKEGKILPWGYFVAPGDASASGVGNHEMRKDGLLRVLWVGRMLWWKRLDTLIRSTRGISLDLTLVGDGPERNRLQKMARGLRVRFLPVQTLASIRCIMREHDVYVLSSNGYEGWGAVVSEALEEGMKVIGTHEAGSSATMLSEDDLYHSGDWRRLSRLLARCADEKRRGVLKGQGIGDWNVATAARKLVAMGGSKASRVEENMLYGQQQARKPRTSCFEKRAMTCP